MIKKLNDELREKLVNAVRDAHEEALNGNRATVWFDLRDGDIWTNYNDPGGYKDEEIVGVVDVQPYTLEELFSGDENLEEDPEGFREWYLNDDCDNALCQSAYVEYWERNGFKETVEYLDRK